MNLILALALVFTAGAAEDIDIIKAKVCVAIAKEKVRLDEAQVIQIINKSVFEYEATQGKITADIIERWYNEISKELVDQLQGIEQPNLNHYRIQKFTEIDGHKFRLPRQEHIDLNTFQLSIMKALKENKSKAVFMEGEE